MNVFENYLFNLGLKFLSYPMIDQKSTLNFFETAY